MTDKPENPPAFPMPASEHSLGGHHEQYGMDLRDWFAGMALQGVHARGEDTRAGEKYIAIYAYQMADAMLAERGRK
jgi:hypothetical protein